MPRSNSKAKKGTRSSSRLKKQTFELPPGKQYVINTINFCSEEERQANRRRTPILTQVFTSCFCQKCGCILKADEMRD